MVAPEAKRSNSGQLAASAARISHSAVAIVRSLSEDGLNLTLEEGHLDSDYFGKERPSWGRDAIPLDKSVRSFTEAYDVLECWAVGSHACNASELGIYGEEAEFVEWVGRKAWFPVATDGHRLVVVLVRSHDDAEYDRESVALCWLEVQRQLSLGAIEQETDANIVALHRGFANCCDALSNAPHQATADIADFAEAIARTAVDFCRAWEFGSLAVVAKSDDSDFSYIATKDDCRRVRATELPPELSGHNESLADDISPLARSLDFDCEMPLPSSQVGGSTWTGFGVRLDGDTIWFLASSDQELPYLGRLLMTCFGSYFAYSS